MNKNWLMRFILTMLLLLPLIKAIPLHSTPINEKNNPIIPVEEFIDSLENNGIKDWIIMGYWADRAQRSPDERIISQGACEDMDMIAYIFWKDGDQCYLNRLDKCYVYEPLKVPKRHTFFYFKILRFFSIKKAIWGRLLNHGSRRYLFLGSYTKETEFRNLKRKHRLRPRYRFYSYLYDQAISIPRFEPKTRHSFE